MNPKNRNLRSLQRATCSLSSFSGSLRVLSFALPARGRTVGRSGFHHSCLHLSRWPSASRRIGFTFGRAEHRRFRQPFSGLYSAASSLFPLASSLFPLLVSFSHSFFSRAITVLDPSTIFAILLTFLMRRGATSKSPNKTDAGNGSYGTGRVIDASRSLSPDPKR